MTTPKHSKGTTVTIGAAVAFVESVTAAGSLETAEVRALSSQYVERVAGLIDLGTIEMTGYANGANFAALVALRDAATTTTCTVTGSDGSTVTFRGLVTAVSLIADIGGAIKFSATVTAAGPVT